MINSAFSELFSWEYQPEPHDESQQAEDEQRENGAANVQQIFAQISGSYQVQRAPLTSKKDRFEDEEGKEFVKSLEVEAPFIAAPYKRRENIQYNDESTRDQQVIIEEISSKADPKRNLFFIIITTFTIVNKLNRQLYEEFEKKYGEVTIVSIHWGHKARENVGKLSDHPWFKPKDIVQFVFIDNKLLDTPMNAKSFEKIGSPVHIRMAAAAPKAAEVLPKQHIAYNNDQTKLQIKITGQAARACRYPQIIP